MTFTEFFTSIFTGNNIALIGAAFAAIAACMGSARGVGIACEAGAGVITEDPSKAGKVLLLEALPGSQGIYGFVTAFMVVYNLGIIGGSVASLSVSQGIYYLIACLPIGIVGYQSAIKQGRVCAAGMNILSKRPDDFIKGVIAAALVETYAIFALLVSLLLVLFFR